MNKKAEMLVLNFGSLLAGLLAAISLKRHKKFPNKQLPTVDMSYFHCCLQLAIKVPKTRGFNMIVIYSNLGKCWLTWQMVLLAA